MKYLLLFFVVLGLLFAGCSQVPSTQSTTTTTDADTQTQPAPTTTDSAQSAPIQTTPSVETSEVSSVTKELEALFEKQFDLEYGVVYSFTAQGPDAGTPGTIANYVVGLKKMRFDTIMDGYETRSYMTDEKFTTCNKFDGEWTCSTFESSDSDATYDESSNPIETTEDIQENLDSYNIEKLPDRTVANVKTSCYKITMVEGVTEYCYSSEAVPLYIKTSSTDEDGQTYTTIMQATSYMTSVSDSYFELPAGYVETESQGGAMSQEEIDALMAQYATE